VKSSDGDKYIRVVLQKESDIWQVVNFRSSEKPLDTDTSKD
jgi:hypothetical protein